MRKGFTLIEVLLATAILATILVITTAVVSQTSTYRTKLVETRKAGEAVRSIADLISNDLRSKTVQGELDYVTDAGTVTYTYPSGVAELFCSDTEDRLPKMGTTLTLEAGCIPMNNSGAYNGAMSMGNNEDPYLRGTDNDHPAIYNPFTLSDNTFAANTLIIFLPDNKVKIYWSTRNIETNLSDLYSSPGITIIAKWAYGFYYKEIDLTSPEIGGKLKIGKATEINWWTLLGGTAPMERMTQFSDGEVGVLFGGYCPDSTSTLSPQQPYVRFYVEAKTLRFSNTAVTGNASRGYAYLPLTDRGIATIQSSVTLRNYQE